MSEEAPSELSLEIQHLIDQKFGDDISNLSEIGKLYNDILQRKLDLEEEMKVPTGVEEVEGEQNVGTYKDGIINVLEQLERCENVQTRKKEIVEEIDTLLSPSIPGCEKFLTYNEEIKNQERYIKYMKYVAKINETSESVQQSILSDSMTDACLAFKRLITYHGCLIDKSTKCRNVTLHLHRTIMFWYRILKDKLSKDLENILQMINWPFTQMRGPDRIAAPPVLPDLTRSPMSPQKQHKQEDPQTRLEAVIGNLLNVQLPKHVRNFSKTQKSSEAADSGDAKEVAAAGSDEHEENSLVLLPFQIMLRPLRKRFHYHFSGTKETNAIEKPEWYLSQVANWVEYHSGFLENTIQPILDKHKHQYVDALIMFTQGLLQLVSCKLAIDIDIILGSDDLFSHLVDEVLVFDRDLRNLHDIPTSLLQLHSPLNILALPKCIDKWLNIEKAWANEKLENLLEAPRSWKAKFAAVSNLEDDVDESKVPECAESVVTMLLTVTDRYKNLPGWEEKVRFLDFQLSILDDFRLRITQVIRSITCSAKDDQTYAIINTAHYITTVLEDWADNLFFLELKHHKQKLMSKSSVIPPSLVSLTEGSSNQIGDGVGKVNTDETVFDEAILLYKKIFQDGIESVEQQTLTDLKTKCYPYITESWSSLEEPNEQVTLIVSRTICPFLGALQERLMFLEERFTSYIFSKLWRSLAEKLDIFLFQEVVMKSRFNSGGAAQLQYDMKENMFPLFRSLTTKPDSYFKRIKESCLLLNLQLGSALLLKETVVDEEVKSAKKMLAEMKIHLINPKDAATILTRRMDWPSEI